MKKYLITLHLFMSLSVVAQDGAYSINEDDYGNTSVEMADTMRSNGKIYVVVAVVMTIFTGLIAYTIVIDRKVSRIEKEVFNEKG
ncbi:CcmD family protein [Roseivirga sp.]|uniref:CcmD family protein n=1 Tax=Roseivirga sp. TaxID=1964215 RepID=UPI003B51F0A4